MHFETSWLLLICSWVQIFQEDVLTLTLLQTLLMQGRIDKGYCTRTGGTASSWLLILLWVFGKILFPSRLCLLWSLGFEMWCSDDRFLTPFLSSNDLLHCLVSLSKGTTLVSDDFTRATCKIRFATYDYVYLMTWAYSFCSTSQDLLGSTDVLRVSICN